MNYAVTVNSPSKVPGAEEFEAYLTICEIPPILYGAVHIPLVMGYIVSVELLKKVLKVASIRAHMVPVPLH